MGSQFVIKHPAPIPGVSYGSPLTIDTISTNIPMYWRDYDVITNDISKIAKIVKNRQNQGFSPFLWPKCVGPYSFAVVIGVRVGLHLGMASIKIIGSSTNIASTCSLKLEKTHCCFFPLKSTGWVAVTPTRTCAFDFSRDTLTPLKVTYLWFFFSGKMTSKDVLTTTCKRLVKYLGVLVQSEKKSIGGHSDPPLGKTRVKYC